MALRFLRTFLLAMLTIALLGPSPSRADDKELRSMIAFTSSRAFPGATAPQLGNATEIYLMNPEVNPAQQDPRRLTDNDDGEAFPVISPDGKKIVFDSNRRRTSGEPNNTSDLFLMNADGSEETFLTRGSSASFSPDSKSIAFHASASGNERPIRGDAGSATKDSDIFVMNVDDCLKLVAASEQLDPCHEEGSITTNLTNNGDAIIEDDVDWSPDGQQIVFTSHNNDDYDDDSTSAEINVINADGTGGLIRLTNNNREERAPEWSPDGTHIAFGCRPDELAGIDPLEICVMEAQEDAVPTQLTHNNSPTTPRVFHTAPTWSPDGTQIVFHRAVLLQPFTLQLWMMNADGTDQTNLTDPDPRTCRQGDCRTGINLTANWGVVRITGQDVEQVAADSQDRAADQGKHDKHKGKKDTKHTKRHGGGKRHR